MRFGKLFVVGSVFLILVLLAAGCARATPAPKPTATPAPAATPVPTPAVAATPTPAPAPVAATPTPVAKPKPEGILRMARSSWYAEVLDPNLGATPIVIRFPLLYDGLVGESWDGNDISQDTGLAYKWEQSKDGLSWTFYLRKGVQFDKGWGEATAEDVKFSLERVIREGTLATQAATLKKQIKNIEVIDPYTVKINLNTPAITLPFNLSFIMSQEGTVLPKKYIEKVGDKEFAVNPIGTGPYRLVKLEPGLYMKFEARSDYWLGTPRFREVYLFAVAEEASRLAMLKTGEVDIAEVSILRLKEFEVAGFKIFEKAGSNQVYLHIDGQWEGFNADARVRQAYNLAINKQEMLDTLFVGKGQLLPGIVHTWALGAKFFKPYPYDPKRAKELLAEAGYAKGFDLKIVIQPMDPLPLVGQAVAGYMDAIGTRPQIVNMDNATMVDAKVKRKLTGAIDPYGAPNRIFTAPYWRAAYHSQGYVGTAADPKLDALIEQAEQAKSLDELAQLQGQIVQQTYDNFILIPLLQLGYFYAVSPKTKIEKWNVGGKSMYEHGLAELLIRR